MAIAQNFPEIAPSLDLSFALTKKLDPRITFSRASSATYYGNQTAKAEENLLLRSQEFDNAVWVKTSVTVGANTTDTTAPDGTATAEKVTTTGNNPFVQQINLNYSGNAVFSVFAKKGELDWLRLSLNTATFSAVWFNLDTGVVGTESGSFSPVGSIVDAGNGWYRCIVSVTGVSSQTTVFVGATNADNTTTGYTGNGTESLYLWGAQLEQRSAPTAYLATTTQPITNYIPVLETASAGVARFDHSPTTGESLGLLVEEQRTNLLLRSEEFDNASWTKTNSSITANTVVAPDGTLTMDKLVEDTATGFHRVNQSPSIVSGTTYTLSAYFKAGERTRVSLQLGGANFTFTIASFDLIAGTVLTGTGTITSVGNGVYRCSISSLAVGTGGGNAALEVVDDSGNRSYTGDGYSGIYIWGAQLEAGAFPTSYIKTEASQVTRSADSASMTGANFSSWYNQAAGTFYSDVIAPNKAITGAQIRSPLSVDDGSNNNVIVFGHGASVGEARYTMRSNATEQLNTVAQALIANVFTSANGFSAKLGISYAFNNAVAFANTTLGAVSTSVAVPVVNRLLIGDRFLASSNLNGHIRKLSYYPQRLSDVQLQGLTS